MLTKKEVLEYIAENEEEAFIIASDFAMQSASWEYSVKEIKEEDEE